MSLYSRIKAIYLAHFSRPASDRILYRAVTSARAQRILEIGMGPISRSLKFIDLAQRIHTLQGVRFTAIDLFEARPDASTGVTLKDAHRQLKPTGAQVQLIPGDPASALARSANQLAQMDLVIISAAHDESSLAGAWFYLPRMLHVGSQVYLESRTADGQATYRRMASDEIERLAGAGRRRRAA